MFGFEKEVTYLADPIKGEVDARITKFRLQFLMWTFCGTLFHWYATPLELEAAA